MSAVLRIGNDSGYVDRPDTNSGTQDFAPTLPMDTYSIRNLVECRMAALSGKGLFVPLTWNDVMYAYRMVYGRSQNALGNFADIAKRIPNLLFAYSPAAKLGYSNAIGTVTGTTDTDVTGKTFTQAQGQIMEGIRVQVANGVSTAPLVAGSLDNQVWVMLAHGEPTVAALPSLYLRRTDANNWIRIFRQSATNVRIEKDVASAVTTEADVTVPTTEPLTGSAYAIRINGATAQVYVNGTLYGTVTLSAGAQGLTGLQVGFDTGAAARAAMGEIEVWSTAYPGYSS